MLPPESAAAELVAREVGVGAGTLQRWRDDAQSMPAHMRALRAVGVPYTDAQIASATEELKDKTELDATIAYLQMLGLALK